MRPVPPPLTKLNNGRTPRRRQSLRNYASNGEWALRTRDKFDKLDTTIRIRNELCAIIDAILPGVRVHAPTRFRLIHLDCYIHTDFENTIRFYFSSEC
jgi:hypothetical protein